MIEVAMTMAMGYDYRLPGPDEPAKPSRKRAKQTNRKDSKHTAPPKRK